MYKSIIDIDPVQYVNDKSENVTIDLKSKPIAKVEKVDNELFIKTRRFSSRDRQEISPFLEKITIKDLMEEKALIEKYLDDLNTLISDLNKINIDATPREIIR